MTGLAAVLLAAALVAVPLSNPLARIAGDTSVSESTSGSVKASPGPLAVASAFDLLAACLHAGLPMAKAAVAVADSAPHPLATLLCRAGDMLALGAEPVAAWGESNDDPALASLARLARRSALSGAALASALHELAVSQRALAEDEAVSRAERAGVLVSGPLGLCFLPAFVCLGIVPVVVGLAGGLLHGGLL
ncbi:type II secretion system F family protein [Skermania sp. ID1734]|uniref:type II secretion system F family protein n=1 Tax=Skermania sp. ID1734 TaxID=2597516 RepID=UPI00117C2213|nr:type II secretion system F family protein [Skermania sp. ID1734]TSE00584.1 type II secretion system F family protein [Skermania sp. ID1734]